jgi:hypothetical protein
MMDGHAIFGLFGLTTQNNIHLHLLMVEKWLPQQICYPQVMMDTALCSRQSPDSFRSEISSQIPPTMRTSPEGSRIGNIVESQRTIAPSTANFSTV